MNNLWEIGKGKKLKYDKDSSIINFIKKQVDKHPENIAVVDDFSQFTYRDFFHNAVEISKRLKMVGIGVGDRVLIYEDPSCELIILILAILLNGSTYICLDTAYPKHRVELIIKDCLPSMIVTKKSIDNHESPLVTARAVDFLPKKKSGTHYEKDISIVSSGLDPAYIIYTSGSTGVPKGIIVPHRSVNNHMLWMSEEFSLTQYDRFLLKTPLGFDPSVWEMLLPFYIGATLYIANSGTHSNAKQLLSYIKRYDISVIQLVPVVLHRFLLEREIDKVDSLKHIFVGGESLSTKTKSLFFERNLNSSLINLYGPAEATIDTTFYEVSRKDQDQDIELDYIGRPINNVDVYVLSEDLMPCHINQVGEIYIAGDGLSLRYIDETRSKESFIKIKLNNSYRVAYKTGDLAKWSDNKNLEYIGRIDNQIKINGVRLEVDELKKAILANPNIYNCEIKREYSDIHNYSYLLCFLFPVNDADLDLEEIKSHLREIFPAYMLPKKYIVSENLPLSLNGKIITKRACENALDKSLIDYDSELEKSSSIEDKLAVLWGNVLSIPKKDIGHDIDFFELGGDSIGVLILHHKIEENFTCEFSVNELFSANTIRKQKQFIQDLIENIRKKQTKNTILSLNSSVDEDMFLIHPVGGTIFWYKDLAKLVDKKVHIYGIQDPEITLRNIVFNSIYEMADYYTECILSLPHRERYILGGASFGATVAVEVAKNLRKQHKNVGEIYVFDGWAIYPNELEDKEYFYDSMMRQQKIWKDRIYLSDIGMPTMNEIFEIQMKRISMLFEYHIKPIDFHIKLFKAKEIMPIFESIDDKLNHWGKVCKHIELTHVPGNHETMFNFNNVKVITNKIIESIIYDFV